MTIDELSRENADLKKQLRKSRSEEKNAKHEAARYQSQLGSAIDVRWGNDPQLTNDIGELKRIAEEFVQVRGRNFEVIEDASLELLEKYKCKEKSANKKINSLLSFALQRLVLESIFNEIKKLTEDEHRNSLEASILYHTNELTKYMDDFSKTRDGKDSITAVTPVKIRQQSYAALASRGFSNSDDPFVNDLSACLLGEMEKYRKVLNDVRKEELQDESKELIRLGTRLWLRLRTRESVPKIKWFKSGENLKSHLMEGSWDVDETNDLEVGFCCFPAILIKEDNKVFHKAFVLTQKKKINLDFIYLKRDRCLAKN